MSSIMTREKFVGLTFNTEDQFSSAVNMYVSHNYESLRHFYFHIANENKDEVSRRKGFSMGVLAGVPDFLFLKPKHWWLELKMRDGRLSEAQKKLHPIWKQYGEHIEVAYSPHEVAEILGLIIGPPKFAV